jgi:MFS family permease
MSTGVAGNRVRMWVAVGSHLVVDFFSFIIVPLMSVLKGQVGMDARQGAIVVGAGAVASGLIQPLVAVESDRRDTRLLGTLGLVVAALAISAVGFARSFEALLLLQIVGAAGIGAFHPVAAAAVGQLAPRRSHGIALFYTAGMVGGVLGNMTSPTYVSWAGGAGGAAAGTRALAYLALPGLLAACVLAWAIHGAPHTHADAAAAHAALGERDRRERWRAVWLLYAGNVLRFMVDMCLIQLIIRWTEQKALAASGGAELTAAVREHASHLNGPLQAAKQAGMGVGALLIGFLVPRRMEKRVLVVVPLIGAVFVALMPRTGPWSGLTDTGAVLAILACGVAGVGYAGVVPTTIAMAQRLLPHRTSLASGLMLGGAWSVGALGPTVAEWLATRAWGLEGAFVAVGLMLVAAGALAALLPRELVEGSPQRP